MKKIIWLVVSVVALAFTSCTEREEIDFKYQVNVKIDPSEVISSVPGEVIGNEIYGKNLKEDEWLKITSLIYNKDELLVEKKESLVKDYESIVNYSLNIAENEEYTIVVFTFAKDIVKGIDSYIITNDSTLKTLSVKAFEENGDTYYSSWTVFGTATKVIKPENKSNLIKVKPTTASVTMHYIKPTAHNEDGVDMFLVTCNNNDIAFFENGIFNYKSTLPNGYGWKNELDLVYNQHSDHIIELYNFLPTKNMYIGASYCIGEEQYYFEKDIYVDIEPGNHYNIYIDCESLQLYMEHSTRFVTPINDLKIGVKKAHGEFTDISPCFIKQNLSSKLVKLI